MDAIFWLIIIIVIILLAWRLNLVSYVALAFAQTVEKTGSYAFNWDDIEIIDTLGSGANGIVYKIKSGNEFFALKREKILPTDVDNMQIVPNYETQFYDFINSLPAEEQKYFIKRIASRVTKCDYVHALPEFVKVAQEQTERYKSLSASPYCAETIMELGGKSLLASNLTSEQWRYVTGQIVRLIQIMRSHGYTINDFHTGNVILRDDGPKPSIALIDYGEIRHISSDSWCNKYYYMNLDLLKLFGILHNGDQFWIKHLSKLKEFPKDNMSNMAQYIKQLPAVDGASPWDTVYRYAVMIDPQLPKHIDRILLGEQVKDVYYCFSTLLMVLYPNFDIKYWSNVVGYDIPPNDMTSLIPRADLLFMLDHYHDMTAIIKHFE
jgi:serine/threonine protein kinase